MKHGTGDRWRARMRDIDEDFTAAVLYVWDRCRKRFAGDSREDPISAQLVLLLQRRRRGKARYRVVYQPSEVTADEKGNAVISGRHDLHLIFDLEDDDASLIYECKRLNVVKDGKRSTLATEYVADGMMRFICCRYAPGVRQGGMLGYVLDGDLATGAAKVLRAISDHADVLLMEESVETLTVAATVERFASSHQRPHCRSPFRIHHLLLPL